MARVTPIIEDIKVDNAYLIPDEEAVPIIFDLLEHEGLCLGGSSGHQHRGRHPAGEGSRAGTPSSPMLVDYGTRYQSKLFNPEFLRSKNLPVPDWLTRTTEIKPPFVKVLSKNDGRTSPRAAGSSPRNGCRTILARPTSWWWMAPIICRQ